MRRLLEAIVGNLREEVVLQGRAKFFEELDPLLSRKASDRLGKRGHRHGNRILAGASAGCKSARKSLKSRHNQSLHPTRALGRGSGELISLDGSAIAAFKPMSLRYIMVSANDEVFRLPSARFDRLLSQRSTDRLPEFAGQRVRAAEIVVGLEKRKPARVLRMIFHYLHFDDCGRLDIERYLEDGRTVMEAGIPLLPHDAKGPKVVQAGQRFAARRRDHSVWWKPSPGLKLRILEAALGNKKYHRL